MEVNYRGRKEEGRDGKKEGLVVVALIKTTH